MTSRSRRMWERAYQQQAEQERLDELLHAEFAMHIFDFTQHLKHAKTQRAKLDVEKMMYEYLARTPYPWEANGYYRRKFLTIIDTVGRKDRCVGMWLYSLISHRLRNEVD